jgi:hypothetical protein
VSTAKSCRTCAFHDPAKPSLDDAHVNCWGCSAHTLAGLAHYPKWQEKPVVLTPSQVATQRINAALGKGDHLETQIGGDHYKALGIQPIEVMKEVMTPEEVTGFLKGNLLKYSIRQGRKEGTDDANKARHYATLLKQHLAEIGK